MHCKNIFFSLKTNFGVSHRTNCYQLEFKFSVKRLSRGFSGKCLFNESSSTQTFTPRQRNQKAQFLIKWVHNLYTLILVVIFGTLLLTRWASKYENEENLKSQKAMFPKLEIPFIFLFKETRCL